MPEGLTCPHCGCAERRLFRAQGQFPAYRCRACDGYYTLLTGTVFAKTRQRPATLVLLLRGIAKGEPTARLARELGLSRKQLHTLRQRIQANLNATAPTGVMPGTAFEADELLSERRGKKARPIATPRIRPAGAPISARGHGTYANDRPPIISVISRETGEQRFWVCDHADRRTCARPHCRECPAAAARSCTRMNGRAITAAIRPMPPCAMACTSGPGMMMGMAAARSTAIPAKEPARRSAPTCVSSEVFISSTCIFMWPRMKPWSMRNGSRPSDPTDVCR